MATGGVISTKHLAVSKANAQIVAIMAVASLLTVFCLIASRAVLSQTRYQARVTSADEKATKQLKQNINAFNNLSRAYSSFNSDPINIIGGSTSGTGNNDGNNAKIILDALPSSYDFPALTSSIEKILTSGNFNASSITGTDDQLAQQTNLSSPTPQPVSMPFSFTVDNTSYTGVQQLITTLQSSIRPMPIDSLTLNGSNSSLSVTINAHTYYQPAKSLSIKKQVIK
jgi:hypothetical protein